MNGYVAQSAVRTGSTTWCIIIAICRVSRAFVVDTAVVGAVHVVTQLDDLAVVFGDLSCLHFCARGAGSAQHYAKMSRERGCSGGALSSLVAARYRIETDGCKFNVHPGWLRSVTRLVQQRAL